MNNDYLPSNQGNPTGFGLKVGLVGGLLIMAANLLVFFINGADPRGDGVVWILQVISYFFLGRLAASRQAEAQLYTYEPTRGIVGAGVGAPLVTSFLVWLYIIVRGLIQDAMGILVLVEPFSLCGWIFVDVLLALGIGNWMGRSVEKHHNY